MNREAMLRILNRTREAGAAALADPPTPAICDLAYHTSEPPRDRLWRCLDTWASMDEPAWPEANVRALYEDIMDIFHDRPHEADGWFREWRAAHPAARLA